MMLMRGETLHLVFYLCKMQEKSPDIERFPSHFYEDGIEALALKLRHSQMIAIERFNGNETC